MPKLLSVNVGLPREIAWQGKVVRTAIWKRPVSGRVFARRLNLDGDGQARSQRPRRRTSCRYGLSTRSLSVLGARTRPK